MNKRILVFHRKDAINNEIRIGPTYYMDADYLPVAVRIYAEDAPTSDAKVDIFDDDVSIFYDRASTSVSTLGVRTAQDAATEAILMEGENSADWAGNLKSEDVIEEGSWVHCNLVDSGCGKNFTVQLELERLHAEEEPL